MPEVKGKKGLNVPGMSAMDAQAAAEAAAVKAAAEAKAKKAAADSAAEAKAKVEAYQLKKAAEAAKAEREKNAVEKDVRDKVAAYQAEKDAASQKTYVVKSGDSLSKIAKEQLGDAKRWPEIQKLNKLDNPNLISAGQKLKLPA